MVLINNGANVVLGRGTGATANGRRAGNPLNNGNNPGEGNDRSGLTAVLASMARLDPGLHAGAVQNIKLDRGLFRGAGRQRLRALLDAWFANGGSQAMLTVVDPADLQAAMREPERWGHLIVRVGGFSARFTQLDRDTQLHILQRTLHG
ncbi:MAG: glycine radical domain-containing protein [Planctomycetota bacterium]